MKLLASWLHGVAPSRPAPTPNAVTGFTQPQRKTTARQKPDGLNTNQGAEPRCSAPPTCTLESPLTSYPKELAILLSTFGLAGVPHRLLPGWPRFALGESARPKCLKGLGNVESEPEGCYIFTARWTHLLNSSLRIWSELVFCSPCLFPPMDLINSMPRTSRERSIRSVNGAA